MYGWPHACERLALAKGGRCCLNGHMIDIIGYGVNEGNALPLVWES